TTEPLTHNETWIAYQPGEMILFQHGKPIKKAITKLHWLVREYPFNNAHLIDLDVEVDFSQVTTPEDRVAVITTEPLTHNETWIAYQPGEMILFQHGKPIKKAIT
ncbi:hypothetical protein EDM35_16190, partial [Staphylococcus aureus]|uniref:class II glutamine amidotransferase n=1 Tax=Staphylococcus aureus TaxID=1280 RepID=UPI000F3E25DD